MPQPLRGQRSDRIVRKENSELGRVSYGCTCPAGRVRRIKSTRSDACFEDIMSYLSPSIDVWADAEKLQHYIPGTSQEVYRYGWAQCDFALSAPCLLLIAQRTQVGHRAMSEMDGDTARERRLDCPKGPREGFDSLDQNKGPPFPEAQCAHDL
jgi:hypothetical protein